MNSKWTSGNDTIDKFIQDAQLNVLNINQIAEIDINEKLKNFQKSNATDITITTTPMNYKTHPQAIYIIRILNFLMSIKNKEDFERELGESTEMITKIWEQYTGNRWKNVEESISPAKILSVILYSGETTTDPLGKSSLHHPIYISLGNITT
ncbi:hypothetical protein Glove_21g126 [Diversispora epigaea]|uniref:Uncharacterized protein n=1 Tax=Diversispora epigaea TaxID=1348612 RepID=A0A397JP99_9GLOM|nr:hypothetical protein Glove_21g126 [Diversispora epigaea]